jgi:hypothetical protein
MAAMVGVYAGDALLVVIAHVLPSHWTSESFRLRLLTRFNAEAKAFSPTSADHAHKESQNGNVQHMDTWRLAIACRQNDILLSYTSQPVRIFKRFKAFPQGLSKTAIPFVKSQMKLSLPDCAR